METNKETFSEFIDAENFSSGKGSIITFEFLVLKHISKIMELSCTEFRSSYKDTNIIQLGNGLVQKHEVYHADNRKQFIQAIDTFSDVMMPFYDKTATKEITELESNTNSLDEQKETDILKILKLKRSMFRSLIALLKRNNFLKGSAIE